jgi:hypothetical protein
MVFFHGQVLQFRNWFVTLAGPQRNEYHASTMALVGCRTLTC